MAATSPAGVNGKMEYLIGLLLSLAAAGLAITVGLDRDRAFYPTVLIVIASYYRTLVVEILVASGFLLLATIGFKQSLWFVAMGLIGHGVFDIVHHLFIENPGVPHWWPGFCLVFDVILGGLLAVRLLRRSLAAR